MSNRVIISSRTTLYLIVVVVIIAAFLLLGGGPWIRGIMHGSRPIIITQLNWAQVLVSLALGFVLGLLAGRRKW
jgi:hypothetical protein